MKCIFEQFLSATTVPSVALVSAPRTMPSYRKRELFPKPRSPKGTFPAPTPRGAARRGAAPGTGAAGAGSPQAEAGDAENDSAGAEPPPPAAPGRRFPTRPPRGRAALPRPRLRNEGRPPRPAGGGAAPAPARPPAKPRRASPGARLTLKTTPAMVVPVLRAAGSRCPFWPSSASSREFLQHKAESGAWAEGSPPPAAPLPPGTSPRRAQPAPPQRLTERSYRSWSRRSAPAARRPPPSYRSGREGGGNPTPAERFRVSRRRGGAWAWGGPASRCPRNGGGGGGPGAAPGGGSAPGSCPREGLAGVTGALGRTRGWGSGRPCAGGCAWLRVCPVFVSASAPWHLGPVGGLVVGKWEQNPLRRRKASHRREAADGAW